MPYLLALALLVLGLVAGWLIGRRRRAAPDEAQVRGSEEQADEAWTVDVRSVAEAVPLPTLAIGRDDRIAYANGLALQGYPQLAPGVDPGDVSASLAEIARRTMAGEEATAREPVFLGEPVRSLRVAAVGFGDGVLLMLADVTEDVDFEEARRTFSAAVSHELRTPLARILGLAESLALPDLEDEREALVLQIEHEVEGMRNLIDEMLLLAALDRGRLAVADGVVDAAAVARQVVADAQDRRIGRGREIALTAPASVEVPVAQRLLEVVIQNLVDNALIHGGPDAAVRVTVAGDADNAVIVVEDTGIGIPAQHLPFVFQRFYRGDASRTGPGSGLGLALVKHIVEAHGGEVGAESDGVSGTTLRVTLPRA